MSSVNEEAARRPRGRPRAFDRDAALRCAMEVFWEKGFDGTSMSDLADAMGINSPSLYAAFGGKEDLFREALGLYGSAEGAIARRALEENAGGREAIAAMFRRNIELFTRPGRARGCMLILGTIRVGAEHEALRAMLRKGRLGLTSMIRKRLLKAVEDGQLAPSVDTESLAALCVTVLCGISVQAHDGASRASLISAIDAFVASLPFDDKPRGS
ncbi:TetR family transcriptional regulator [Caballeronia arationis]|jgi:AcrR family transcriptional regulator|uniref:Transcriptional regulator, TetR family n=1 Tax=Caballeronia arationis TaxID=1777142 RepID=A0A7Z7I5A9_9BURK|nr:TetR/AcrR family transcriptional regulator [Caballeronia arationis]SAK54516.1 TetR family transcriptional regulator [Caballeronia arationis]SOE61178.1 transcriptional regulator, TetR family [Caballeronia arationis]